MEKPYLRKLEELEEFEVWEVDGMYVRNNLNREFTNFGQHYRFPFIPKHQFWIDKENSPCETAYYVSHMLIEWHLMDQGTAYDVAIEKADKHEQRERKKSALLKQIKKDLARCKQQIPDKVYIKKLADSEAPRIWLVNGELVRDLYFIDFTEGGHHFVYDFVPYNEVWLDNDLTPAEREFVLLHELHERYLMFKGWDYDRAHNSSSYIEYQCRRNPKLLAEKMNAEMANNALIKPEFVSELI
ncbi:hypothetical protein KKG63_03030 [Patescibacteria group bacterium]|nr:hypothetical protein [Patescibacteria group bacterium]